jgi:hypothetical protein
MNSVLRFGTFRDGTPGGDPLLDFLQTPAGAAAQLDGFDQLAGAAEPPKHSLSMPDSPDYAVRNVNHEIHETHERNDCMDGEKVLAPAQHPVSRWLSVFPR